MLFIRITLITALIVAGCAAFFSVDGLASIYKTQYWPVIAMGASIEIGKLVGVSYLYRQWDAARLWFKAYMMTVVLALMLLTSVGIYGFLSAGYQESDISRKGMTTRIALLEQERTELKTRITEINYDISRIDSNIVSKRIELMSTYNIEKTAKELRIKNITSERLELAQQQLVIEAHTGPIVYIAEQMGKSVDDAVSLLTLLIIIVFDPLAIGLTLAYNQMLVRYKGDVAKEKAEYEESELAKRDKTIAAMTVQMNKNKAKMVDLAAKLTAAKV